MSGNCRSTFRCAKCGEKHDTRTCEVEEKVKCCNCGGAHKASSRECQNYEQAQEISRVKTVQKISYADAIKQVKGKNLKVNAGSGPAQAASSNQSKSQGTPQKVYGPPKVSVSQAPKVSSAPFDWNEFAAFMVKASSMFSNETFQGKSELQKIGLFA